MLSVKQTIFYLTDQSDPASGITRSGNL